ncbi:ABC transporter permease subunit [Bacillaceae bacterium Marseille-Q3522]|nr:ABC transporter permease subunit [Bacillaceae bacterium Marseille-Q3522]
MIHLIHNEWMKIFSRVGTYVMIGLLLLIVTISGAFIKYQEGRAEIPDNETWQNALEVQIASQQSQLDELEEDVPLQAVQSLQREIAINQYRLQHNISPNVDYSMWTFVENMSFLVELVSLFTIIIAASIVASEFTWGTIKLLLIRPITRTKILLSKFITVCLFGLLLLAILFSFSAILGMLFFGTPEIVSPHLSYFNGIVMEQSMPVYMLFRYGLSGISIFMFATFAFMLSTIFRNSSLSIGLSIFLLFTGYQVTGFIAMRYEWAKYLLFANLNISQYFEGVPIVYGMTLTFSIIVLCIYFFIFQFLTFFVFKKRDVAS